MDFEELMRGHGPSDHGYQMHLLFSLAMAAKVKPKDFVKYLGDRKEVKQYAYEIMKELSNTLMSELKKRAKE